MLRFPLMLLFTCCFSVVFSRPLEKDSLSYFIKITDKDLQEKAIVNYVKINIQDLPLQGLSQKKDSIASVISNSGVENKQGIILLIESIYQKRLLNFDGAKRNLIKGISDAQKKPDHFLLYTFFSYLAFIQTDQGDAINAIYSYSMAQSELKKLKDHYLETILYVNMSDIYYRSGLYNQSLFYLDKAQDNCYRYKLCEINLLRLISYNKTENYFRTGNYDSLSFYHEKLCNLKGQSAKLYTSRNRSGYYLLLLKHNYKAAIQAINTLQADKVYLKGDIDDQHLANAYFNIGQTDSAMSVINNLLARPSMANHPEIQFHLYDMLGEIAQLKHDNKLAAYNFKLSLEQLKQNLNNLTHVGNVSSQIKINDVQGMYYENMLIFKKEQLRLRFIVALAFLTVVVVGIFYRNNRQKRHYDKLVYAAQKHELATINSHEVRNHLSNILGLLDLMKDDDTQGEELIKTKYYLLYSAQQLDKALKNVSQKLSD
ncbi:hypothetical protein [Mucilaginibacter sp. SP1R1]|uniref:hypothetical protein n=1 Tax=Mucilaginibacter sp. SP1R1 TaxID=2723091 RepID=UPI0016072D58|nr:hypothetical protein [Mucilaginibacter sp. SP1R1]MBB6148267.1 hypothetical protein [Mucilaginibacter sp. SP1R1]